MIKTKWEFNVLKHVSMVKQKQIISYSNSELEKIRVSFILSRRFII